MYSPLMDYADQIRSKQNKNYDHECFYSTRKFVANTDHWQYLESVLTASSIIGRNN